MCYDSQLWKTKYQRRPPYDTVGHECFFSSLLQVVESDSQLVVKLISHIKTVTYRKESEQGKERPSNTHNTLRENATKQTVKNDERSFIAQRLKKVRNERTNVSLCASERERRKSALQLSRCSFSSFVFLCNVSCFSFLNFLRYTTARVVCIFFVLLPCACVYVREQYRTNHKLSAGEVCSHD